MAEALEVFRGIGKLVSLASAAARGGRHVTDADLAAIENAALVSENGKIKWVGPEAKLPPVYRKKRAVDLKGRVVIPGLVEPHTHLIFGGNRSAEFEMRNQGVGYQKIAEAGGGILATVRATRQASEKQLAAIGQKRVDRFVKQGVTTIEVKSGYGLSLDEELKILRAAKSLKRARIVPTFLGAHAKPAEFETADTYLDYLIQTALPKVKKEKLATRVDAFVEKGYFSADSARRYFLAAKKLGFGGSIHADQMTLSGGARLAIELGAQSADHLVQLGSDEIAMLAKSDVTCVLLPSADLYMDCAYPKAKELMAAGARVALSTDFNPGTSPSQDVALVGVLARVRMKMTLAETLVAYTVGASHALGLAKQIGSLEKGKACDFAVLTGSIDELFLDVGQMPIHTTYSSGREI